MICKQDRTVSANVALVIAVSNEQQQFSLNFSEQPVPVNNSFRRTLPTGSKLSTKREPTKQEVMRNE